MENNNLIIEFKYTLSDNGGNDIVFNTPNPLRDDELMPDVLEYLMDRFNVYKYSRVTTVCENKPNNPDHLEITCQIVCTAAKLSEEDLTNGRAILYFPDTHPCEETKLGFHSMGSEVTLSQLNKKLTIVCGFHEEQEITLEYV